MTAGGAVRLRAKAVSAEYPLANSDQMFQAIVDVNLDVRDGEFLAVVGPSGCGKTTFINIVDGLLPISSGSIELDGTPIGKPGRDRAMVFQQPSLFPWRTVLDNVIYGLQLSRKHSKAELREIGQRFIDMVGLTGFEKSFPGQLSGGMQQRVNLARALAIDPTMILLDEPFAALDFQTREHMQLELLKIFSKAGKTAIFITHDINEAVFLADRVAVFSKRPGTIKLLVDIDISRPRELAVKRTPEFLAYDQILWKSIEEEAMFDGVRH
jgi:NitT/TauT family transport system ATP-binding protein